MKLIIEVDGNSTEDMVAYLEALNIDKELIRSIKFEK